MYPLFYNNHITGAGEGDRTLTAGLEGQNSTIELHPHIEYYTLKTTYILIKSPNIYLVKSSTY